MLTDLDETIKEMLVRGVPLDLSEIDVAFEAPTGEWSASLARPTVNCYLYHLMENHDLRTNQWEMDRALTPRPGSNGHTGIRRLMPYRVDCCYMVTAWANEPTDEHMLLWRVLGALMRHSTLPRSCLKGLLTGQDWPMPAKVAQPEAPLKNPSDFWSNMDGPIRAGFQYIVTLPLDSDQAIEAPLVFTRRVRTRFLDSTAPAADVPVLQFAGWVRSGPAPDAPPVPGAAVELVERGRRTETDETGRYTFVRVPEGRYTLRARVDGVQTERIIELPGDDYDLVVSLPGPPTAERPPGLAPVGPNDAPGSTPDSSPQSKTRRR